MREHIHISFGHGDKFTQYSCDCECHRLFARLCRVNFREYLARLATVFVSEGRLCLHREGGFITVLSCGAVSHRWRCLMFQCPAVDTDQYLAVRMHEAFGLPIVSREKVETPSSQWNFFAFSITLSFLQLAIIFLLR